MLKKYCHQYKTCKLIAQALKEKKKKKNIDSKEEDTTYCLACRDYTGNVGSKRVTMTNKVIREKPRCDECMSGKSRFLKQRPD